MPTRRDTPAGPHRAARPGASSPTRAFPTPRWSPTATSASNRSAATWRRR